MATTRTHPSDMQPWADPEATPDLEMTFAQPQKWLNSNQIRGHWAKTDPIRRYWRNIAHVTARSKAKGKSFDRAHVVFTFHLDTRRSFDPANLGPQIKAMTDGFTDAGLWVDDSHRHVVGPDARYGEPGEKRIVVRVYDLGGAA